MAGKTERTLRRNVLIPLQRHQEEREKAKAAAKRFSSLSQGDRLNAIHTESQRLLSSFRFSELPSEEWPPVQRYRLDSIHQVRRGSTVCRVHIVPRISLMKSQLLYLGALSRWSEPRSLDRKSVV